MSPSNSGGSEFHRALAAELSALRVARHTSQGTLAAELGIDQAAVSRVESGHRRLGVGETFAWLEALGLSAFDSADRLRELWELYGERPPGFWTERDDD